MAAAGLLTIAAIFMPWFFMMGFSVNGFTGNKPVWIVFMVTGALLIAMALIDKKWSAAVSILFSLIIGGLGAKYYHDASSGMNGLYGGLFDVGAGIYCLVISGVLGITSALFKLFSKKKEPVIKKEKFGESFDEYT